MGDELGTASTTGRTATDFLIGRTPGPASRQSERRTAAAPHNCFLGPLTKVELSTPSLLSVVAGPVKPEPSYYEDIHDSDRDQPQPEGLAPVRDFPCAKCHGDSGCKEKE
ncbi:MAG: hypothetical protein KY452_06695 [Actinobacteria bacterium]|nr:hypothetical protein [Actinomycetota bacterium]